MKNIILWFKIIRPHTLFASFCPVLVGLMAEGVSSWGVAAVTLLCALSLQILSNLINDYYDFRRGSDKAGRVGPSRALAEGKVTEAQMLRALLITLVFCVVSGFFLVLRGGWPILLIGVASLLFAWLYTATRFALSYLGIADVFVFLFYGVVASAGTAYLQMRGFSWTAFHAGAVCGLISMCLLIINNLRDIEDDRAAGKRTFPVRFGKRAGELGMLVVVLLMPLFAWLAFGLDWPMLVVLPALALFVAVLRAEGSQYNRLMLGAGFVNLVYTALCALV
ncbi:MAG: 1,4-dihydroxy-2-naphthoate octaprenyltransferase [Bacteroidales bacterium]|nr:1,4-dihydroxy-2-naphthoate octaprenyltransferase [Bacteroidales bacterium]